MVVVSKTVVNNRKLFCTFQAYVILGVFLALNKDKDDFADWLRKAAATHSSETKTVYRSLKRWAEKFI